MAKRLQWRWVLAAACVPLVVAGGAFGYEAWISQRADYGWRPTIDRPAFAQDTGPTVEIDHAHHNASTANWWGRFWPFGRLLRADGYRVVYNTSPFTAAALSQTQVLVIANASGGAKPQFLGINLPWGGGADRAAPAFDAREIEAIRQWVANGGALLLVADHAPFGAANASLAQAFGVRMHAGFAEVPGEVSDPLRFTRANGRLDVAHPIVSGAGGGTPVSCVQTFTGQSIDGPADAAILMRLPGKAIETIDDHGTLRPTRAGAAQGLAFTNGKGRVVVLGEAAMLTAQVADRTPFGMQLPGCDNMAFARNVLRWLSTRGTTATGGDHGKR
ncbi:DUF4350 domain-containing protein [Lysobacter sp. KIS68-7]|uniref:DUF4350 domain-containing protein n=1 Tax=Lysobacter sp. KIS68-7 TaxID=2904252 RepID=UPI001E4384C1|nr:DUF4350 domain-containing protein [Lysobacter sp. KIS68-7]UHQ20571.1 DUF4350 domain-containing protein [Lysobacter sp. KIS68-7]